MKTTIQYGGVQSATTFMSVYFEIASQIPSGARIRINKWKRFVVQCNGRNDHGLLNFQRLEMPEEIHCLAVDEYIEITVNNTLKQGAHAFMVTVELPPRFPEGKNFFDILVYKPDGNVADAKIYLEAPNINYGVNMRVIPPGWSSASAGQSSIIYNLGFEVVTEQVGLEYGAILITLPKKFKHLIYQATDVVMSNQATGLPLTGAIFWSNKDDQPNVIRMKLNSANDRQLLKRGTYTFTFPVMLPDRMDAYNVFTITICKGYPGVSIEDTIYCKKMHGGEPLYPDSAWPFISATGAAAGGSGPDENDWTWFSFVVPAMRAGEGSVMPAFSETGGSAPFSLWLSTTLACFAALFVLENRLIVPR